MKDVETTENKQINLGTQNEINQNPTIKTTSGFERFNYKFVETKEIKYGRNTI